METLNYIGSKKTLFNKLFTICHKHIPNLCDREVADLFAGTGSVGFNMNRVCKKIISNDLEYYSYVINYALLKCEYNQKLQYILDDLNTLLPIDNGLIFNNFSPNITCERMFFTNDNAKKCDAIRIKLNQLLGTKTISHDEFIFLLASLLISIDKVANTSSVYGAYLKQFKKSALKPIFIKPIHKNKHNKNIKNNQVFNSKIEDLIKNKTFDIVYLDPPYNHRQYSANYSPLNYIAIYDENIELIGKTGLIKNYNKSAFCSKVNVKKTFQLIINNMMCNYIVLSYNNEGLLSKEELKDILLKNGQTTLYKIKYNKFKAQTGVSIKKVFEYIWIVDKTQNNNQFIEIVL